jgi:Yip1 domain
MILKPKTEWVNVYNETPDNTKSLTYAVILLLIPAVCNFIAYGFIGVKMMGYTFRSVSSGLQQGIMSFVGGILSLYVTAIVIDALATSFDSEKNFGRSMQLVVYSMTPFWVGGVFFLIPGFQPLVFLIGIYGLYLMYQGMPVLMRTPQSKTAGYLVVSIIAMIVVQVIIMLILGVILGLFFASRMGGF